MLFRFDPKNISHYVISFAIIAAVSYVGKSYRQTFADTRSEDYALIRKYLLNENPLYGFNRPKLWIHSKYEYNARVWQSFGSRSSTNLNQPYVHVCIKTIIGQCGEDFNVVLVDDAAFAKLVPRWDMPDLATLASPARDRARDLGMAMLLRIYGGMTVPNTFVCARNLRELYDEGTADKEVGAFVCEGVTAIESRLMGARKDARVIADYVEFLKALCSEPHASVESEFAGRKAQWLARAARAGRIERIPGAMVGARDTAQRAVGIDALFEESSAGLREDAYGLVIPGDEILLRTKYQWFACMPERDLLAQNAFVCQFMTAALVDAHDAAPARKDDRDSAVMTI